MMSAGTSRAQAQGNGEVSPGVEAQAQADKQNWHIVSAAVGDDAQWRSRVGERRSESGNGDRIGGVGILRKSV